MHRLRCKGEEGKEHHEDGLRIDMGGDVVVNGVEGVEEGVAPIHPSLDSISKGGGLSEDSGEGSTTRHTRSRGTPASSCSRTGSAYWASASFYYCWSWLSGQPALGPPSTYSWPPVVWDTSLW